MSIRKILSDFYWNNNILTRSQKESFFWMVKRSMSKTNCSSDIAARKYLSDIFNIPTMKNKHYYKELSVEKYIRDDKDIKLFAYYLPQMYPTPENDRWWGKGTTEWNNVSRAVPQFLGHYQPRLPGELGFYDLRLKENITRQIELAKLYGIFGFCFYYYWFDGHRMLDKPLDLFINSKDLNFPFCLCWANESWRSTFSSGASETILIEQRNTEESYKRFIEDFSDYLYDERYYDINGKKVIIVYKPYDIPKPHQVISYWREYCKNKGIGELYIIGCWRRGEKYDLLEIGFDAVAEFQPGSLPNKGKNITNEVEIINNKFIGNIFDYADLVKSKLYAENFKKKKLYNAIFPMWDNTPRRNDRGGVIYHRSTPLLYKKWLKDIIFHYRNRKDIEDDIVFINAWNEWGEGAYLEPDKYYGYAYLNATKEAIEESRILFE